jgi:hypothetical protein
MIAQISPLVQGGTGWRTLAAAHIGGAVCGGLAVGALAGLAGMVFAAWSPEAGWRAAVVPLAAGGLALVDLGVLPVTPLSPARQTPRGWACALGPVAAAAAWGADLGLMITTRITLQTALVVLAFALTSGSLVASALVAACYGLGRAGTVMVVARRADRSAQSCEIINAHGRTLRRLAGGSAIVLAVVTLVAYRI